MDQMPYYGNVSAPREYPEFGKIGRGGRHRTTWLRARQMPLQGGGGELFLSDNCYYQHCVYGEFD